MESDSQLYGVLNKAWKSTCRVVLGDEVGELREYGSWLKENIPPLNMTKSNISGKDVSIWENRYCKGARFVRLDEAIERKMDALTINEIKDIDSLIQAVSDKWEYSGNRIQGNSSNVESSDVVVDSQHVADSQNILNSEYVYSAYLVRRDSKYIFGAGGFGEGEFIIRSVDCFNIKRTFESYLVVDSSDIYFSYNCAGCMDAMFCFGQKNKRQCIGNIELAKEKYGTIKAKLLAEIREELKKNKRFPCLPELVPRKKSVAPRIQIPKDMEKKDIAPIEKAFSAAFKVIFKKEARGIDGYGKWLSRNTPKIDEIKSPFGNTAYLLYDNVVFPFFLHVPKDRIVTFLEAIELGAMKMDERDISSLESIKEGLAKIAFFTLEFVGGTAKNAIKCPVVYYSSNVYKIFDATHSEYAGIGTWALNSKYVFGCYRIMESEFCMKCYNSISLSRCFEVNSSAKCLDSMFCSDSEGLSDAMFCFNAKGKRHAIGNTELEPVRYKTIKDSLIEQIADKLEKDRDFKWNIYNIGCAR